jgi:hypothetical protein
MMYVILIAALIAATLKTLTARAVGGALRSGTMRTDGFWVPEPDSITPETIHSLFRTGHTWQHLGEINQRTETDLKKPKKLPKPINRQNIDFLEEINNRMLRRKNMKRTELQTRDHSKMHCHRNFSDHSKMHCHRNSYSCDDSSV